MVSYQPMFDYMKEHNITAYYVLSHGIDNHTWHNIRHGKAITTNTIEKLCNIIKCTPNDIMTFLQDE